ALAYSRARRPGSHGDVNDSPLSRPAPQLQVLTVARPRNHISSLLGPRCDRFVTDARADPTSLLSLGVLAGSSPMSADRRLHRDAHLGLTIDPSSSRKSSIFLRRIVGAMF